MTETSQRCPYGTPLRRPHDLCELHTREFAYRQKRQRHRFLQTAAYDSAPRQDCEAYVQHAVFSRILHGHANFYRGQKHHAAFLFYFCQHTVGAYQQRRCR